MCADDRDNLTGDRKRSPVVSQKGTKKKRYVSRRPVSQQQVAKIAKRVLLKAAENLLRGLNRPKCGPQLCEG